MGKTTIVESYKPEVKSVEWFDDRFYKLILADGKADYLPSVTTKLGAAAKPFLAHWRGEIGNREADMRVFEACERGVRIHNAWSIYCRGGAVLFQPIEHPNYTPEEIEKISAIQEIAILRFQDEMYQIHKLNEWVKAVKPRITVSEITVYSLATRDAGTLDNIMEIEAGDYEVNGSKKLHIPKGTYVVDLKTGNAVDDDAKMQTAAYGKCYESMALGKVDGTIIIHTGSKIRTGIEGLGTILTLKDEMQQDYMDFRSVSAIWERKNKNTKPDVFEFPALITMQSNEMEKK